MSPQKPDTRYKFKFQYLSLLKANGFAGSAICSSSGVLLQTCGSRAATKARGSAAASQQPLSEDHNPVALYLCS